MLQAEEGEADAGKTPTSGVIALLRHGPFQGIKCSSCKVRKTQIRKHVLRNSDEVHRD